MKRVFKFYKDNSIDPPAVFYSFRVYEYRVWTFYYSNRFGWMKIFFKQIYWADTTMHTMGFCEINGYKTLINIFNWKVVIS